MQPQQDKPHIVNASLIALLVIAVYIPAITITAELVPPLKNWLAATYGHHWVGKGIIMMIVYATVFILTAIMGGIRKTSAVSSSLLTLSSMMVIVSSFALIGFFIYEFAIH